MQFTVDMVNHFSLSGAPTTRMRRDGSLFMRARNTKQIALRKLSCKIKDAQYECIERLCACLKNLNFLVRAAQSTATIAF